MSTVLILAIIFILIGIITVNEETNNNDKGTNTDSTQPDSESSSGITQDEPVAVSKPRASRPRKVTKKGSVQPSAKRTSTATKRKAISKGLTISSVVKKKTIKK